MKKPLLIILLAFGLLAASGGFRNAGADSFVSYQGIKTLCKSNNDRETIACLHYLAGVIDGEAFLHKDPRYRRKFCPPLGTSTKRILGEFLRYTQSHRTPVQHSAAFNVYGAMQAAFPCKK